MDKQRREELYRKFYGEWIEQLRYVLLGIYRVSEHLGTTLSGVHMLISSSSPGGI
jgi:hypothetical protein